MGVNFGSLFSGLAQGVQAGFQIGQQRQLMELEQRRSNLQEIEALSNISKIGDPAMRKLAYTNVLPTLGVDPAGEQGKQLITAFEKSDADTMANLSEMIKSWGLENGGTVGAKDLFQLQKNNPTEFWNTVIKFTQQHQQQQAAQSALSIASGEPTSDTAVAPGPAALAATGAAPSVSGPPAEGGAGSTPAVGASAPAASDIYADYPPAIAARL